jgi:hypothetical protein
MRDLMDPIVLRSLIGLHPRLQPNQDSVYISGKSLDKCIILAAKPPPSKQQGVSAKVGLAAAPAPWALLLQAPGNYACGVR